MTQTTARLAMAAIRIDGDTQPREAINTLIVADYAEAMTEGATFPPVTAFFDGVDHWLADGFHRYHAARKIGLVMIDAEVRTGTVEDAQWYSYSVNQTHGIRRTNEDKRKAVLAALKHPNAAGMSDEELALHVGVHRNTILQYRHLAQNVQDTPPSPTRTVTRGESTYTMNVEKIGKGGDNPSPSLPPAPRPVYPHETAEAKAAMTNVQWVSSICATVCQLAAVPPSHPIIEQLRLVLDAQVRAGQITIHSL